jgi:hypothetical protein
VPAPVATPEDGEQGGDAEGRRDATDLPLTNPMAVEAEGAANGPGRYEARRAAPRTGSLDARRLVPPRLDRKRTLNQSDGAPSFHGIGARRRAVPRRSARRHLFKAEDSPRLRLRHRPLLHRRRST